MKFNKYVISTLIVCSFSVNADQIELPHTFSSGTKAVASQVNDNFSALASSSNSQEIRISSNESNITQVIEESNNQSSRISALETLDSKKEQLICKAWHHSWVNGSSIECISSSNTEAPFESITFSTAQKIYAEGWKAESIGGGEYIAILFTK